MFTIRFKCLGGSLYIYYSDGNLFRNTAKVDNKTELLVFITPRIVDDRLSVR